MHKSSICITALMSILTALYYNMNPNEL